MAEDLNEIIATLNALMEKAKTDKQKQVVNKLRQVALRQHIKEGEKIYEVWAYVDEKLEKGWKKLAIPLMAPTTITEITKKFPDFSQKLKQAEEEWEKEKGK